MLEKLFTDNNISSIGFDLDNTLLDTDPYYVRVQDDIYKDFVQTYFDGNDEERIIKELKDTSSSMYRHRHKHGLKPPLISDECYATISATFPDILDDRLDVIIRAHTKDFYHRSPDLYPEAIEFLNLLTEMDSVKHIFGATDAQEEWSEVKARYILENTKLGDFPHYSTDLKVRKNPEWWLSIFSNLHTKPENILVIGDNYYADIYSSLLAGVKHAIWLNRHRRSMEDFNEYPLPKDAEVIVVNSLDEILKL